MKKDDYGEQLAFEYLRKNGYKILHRNFCSRMGEIDLVAVKEKYLIFVEVKSRTSKAYGYGREYVTEAKKRKICKTADYYCLKHDSAGYQYRFDVIEIDLKNGEIEHFENAFDYKF